MVQLGQALTAVDDPPVKALHVYHSNPAVVAPDSARVLVGLEREDLFVVVHEHLMTEQQCMPILFYPRPHFSNPRIFIEATDITIFRWLALLLNLWVKLAQP